MYVFVKWHGRALDPRAACVRYVYAQNARSKYTYDINKNTAARGVLTLKLKLKLGVITIQLKQPKPAYSTSTTSCRT